MPQMCYLLTSPEKFHQARMSGSSSLVSRGPTGKTIPAILKKKCDWSSPLVTQLLPPQVDLLDKGMPESGKPGDPHIDHQ